MKINTNFFYLFFIYCIPLLSWSQFDKNLIPNVIAPPPNVAGLIKYAEIPVSTYNGTASFSVPIYDIKERDLNLSLSASYYSTGLKVEEESSWIGLGWSLNAGGVINYTPMINNFNEEKIIPFGTDVNLNVDQDTNEGAFVFNKVQRGCYFKNENGQNVTLSQASEIVNRNYDYQTYNYNFAGYSGKFIKDRSGNYITLDKNNIIFESTSDNSFKAITPDGTVYLFEIRGGSYSFSNNLGFCSSAPSAVQSNYNYTFYLTKIISPNKNEINFVYDAPYWSKSIPRLIQTYSYSDFGVNSEPRKFTYSQTNTQEYLLKEIITATSRLVFETTPRIDIDKGKKLDLIKVYNIGNNIPVKQISFNYSYFESSSNYGDGSLISNANLQLGSCGSYPPDFVMSTIDSKSKRLKLESVVLSGSTVTGKPKYSFVYNSTVMPYKTSLSQDMWGYFNGAQNYSLLPNVNSLGYYDANVPLYFSSHPESANRMSNEVTMKAGMLEKVTQPTGGYTKIDYEVNRFSEMYGTSTSIVSKQIIVTDYNSKTPQYKEFTIQNIQNQPSKFSISLVCNSHVPCGNDVVGGECAGYLYSGLSSINTTHPNDQRLYGIIERKLANGTWELYEEFTRISNGLVSGGLQSGTCGMLDKNMNLPAGTYRMTANYPDNKTGYLGGPWVEMKLSYLDYATVQYPNIGAGLRVKKIVDFSDGKSYNEKYYTYSGGQLMTKPIFYKTTDKTELLGVTTGYNYDYSCATVFTSADNTCFQPGSGGTLTVSGTPRNVKSYTLFSDPIISNSYSANGALVGYSDVKISYGQNQIGEPNKFIGEETYTYKNGSDYMFYYPSISSGVQAVRYLANGKLLEKVTKKVVNSGSADPIDLRVVKKEVFEYEVVNVKYYWAFKSEYLPSSFYCVDQMIYSSTRDLNQCFIHFYPIKTGKVRLKSKTEMDYTSSLIPTQGVKSVTNYVYNSKNQLINEKTVNSRNEVLEQKTYFPNDLLTGLQATQMQQLITQNRIDIPVKTESIVAGSKVFEQETKYIKDASTNNLLLPKEVHTLKGTGGIDISTATNRKLIYHNYDSKGNVIQYSLDNGVKTCIIWGYDKTLPVAKIENISYESIPLNLILDIENASSTTGSESNLLIALRNLRNASSLLDAMITTYTYKPLIGISSMTDPNGNTVFYFYDDMGRLEFVKDYQGKLISENKYYYKNW